MNFNLIIARYRDPKLLTKLSVPELEELFKVLDTMENPFVRTQNAFVGNPIGPDNIKLLRLILKNVIKEIKRRDGLPMAKPLEQPESVKAVKKIVWNGTQKQLGELFIELKRKGWVDEFDYDAIKNCFTKSDTIQQVLKPATDTRQGEDTYEQVFTPKYKPKFREIKALR